MIKKKYITIAIGIISLSIFIYTISRVITLDVLIYFIAGGCILFIGINSLLIGACTNQELKQSLLIRVFIGILLFSICIILSGNL